MSTRLTITAEELRRYTTDIVDEHLDHFTGRLITAAERGYKRTVHERTFAVAVGASALLVPQSLPAIARRSLQAHDGLDVVEYAYPHVAIRSATAWHDAIDEAWQTVLLKPEARQPQSRDVFGHVELLEALRKHTASFPRP